MKTYQDLEAVLNDPAAKADFVRSFIAEHVSSAPYKMAKDADRYDMQLNSGIDRFLDAMADIDLKLHNIAQKNPRPDTVKSNAFHRLNVQRVAYSLANGITLPDADEEKASLGESFDDQLYRLGYLACIHGESFGFWNADHLDIFKLTDFAPLYDEMDGTLRAGVYFWRLQPDKPMHAVLYEESGYTKYSEESRDVHIFHEEEGQKPYKTKTVTTPGGGIESVEGESYGALPIVPLWNGARKQSTLVNLKGYIDNIDLIVNGFCDDLRECAQVYWVITNYGGMKDDDLRQFVQRLRYNHIANISNNGTDNSVQPYTQEIPTQGREALLTRLHSSMYEDFGGLDVHCVSANSTNDHLEAAYQPLDENARDFENQVTKFVRQILKIAGLPDAKPQYTHVRVSNTAEQVATVISEAAIIGQDMAIDLLPNLTPEQKEKARASLMAESAARETVDEDEDEDDNGDEA